MLYFDSYLWIFLNYIYKSFLFIVDNPFQLFLSKYMDSENQEVIYCEDDGEYKTWIHTII